MSIEIEADKRGLSEQGESGLTLRLVDANGTLIFNRLVPKGRQEANDLFNLALCCARKYQRECRRKATFEL